MQKLVSFTEFLVCGFALGVRRESGDMIPDNRMSASSEDQSHPAKNGRLEDRGWSPDEHNNHDKFPYLYLVLDLKFEAIPI